MSPQVLTRQPFGVLDNTRVQALASMKNRQNAVSASLSAGKEKPTLSAPVKRRAPSSDFDSDFDSENIDPLAGKGLNKVRKGLDGTPQKPSKFHLTTVPSSVKSSITTAPDSRKVTPINTKRNAISNPSTTARSSISTSLSSPKHKRIKMLSKQRSSSASPFKRVNPPSFAGSSIPFSLDAALSGTISSYTPKPDPATEASMPQSWFFDIHVDTPDQEATNLMEHSACSLDISSDDDCDTKRRNEANERGKENIPPPDFQSSHNARARNAASAAAPEAAPADDLAIKSMKKNRRLAFEADENAMATDRSPLSDLPASDFFDAALDEHSAGSDTKLPEQQPEQKDPLPLTKHDSEFAFEMPVPKKDAASPPVDPLAAKLASDDDEAKEEIKIWEDSDVDIAPSAQTDAETLAKDALVAVATA